MAEIFGQEFDFDNPKNTFFHGDCIEGMKAFPDGYFDLILTDPPYGTTRNDWDIKPNLEKMWEQFNRVIKPNGAILVFSQMPFSAELVNTNKKMFRYEWIWKKTLGVNFLSANKMPLRIHENILVFYNAMPTYNPQKRLVRGRNEVRKKTGNYTKNYGRHGGSVWKDTGERYPTDVLEFDNSNHTGIINPTQKPVELLEYLILTYTNKKEKVLDAFAGSGSTLIAAHNQNRIFVGFEKDGEMYKKTKERIDAETAQINIYDLINAQK